MANMLSEGNEVSEQTEKSYSRAFPQGTAFSKRFRCWGGSRSRKFVCQQSSSVAVIYDLILL